MPGFSVGVQSASVVALLQRRTIIAIVTVVRARTTARAVAASIPAAAVRTITRRSAAQRWTVRILLLLNLVAILEHRETRFYGVEFRRVENIFRLRRKNLCYLCL